MDPARAPGTASKPVIFQDGLGERRRISDVSGADTIEQLCLRGELTAIPSFEFALRERASRLANFRHVYYGRVRSVDRLSDPASTLAVVSDSIKGVRLANLLAASERRPMTLDINASVHLMRQLVAAVAILHENARDVAHGAIAPERIIVTPNARVVIVEYVLGAALEQLHFSQERYWRELRVALPSGQGLAHFDHRADVTQIGVVALSLILGRLLHEDEYPFRVGDVLASARAISSKGALEPLPGGLRAWIGRALQLDPQHSFATALEARDELDRVLSGEEEEDEDEQEEEQTPKSEWGASASPVSSLASEPSEKQEPRSGAPAPGAPPPAIEAPAARKPEQPPLKAPEPAGAGASPTYASGWLAMTRPPAKRDGSSGVAKKDEPVNLGQSVLKQPVAGPKQDASFLKQDTPLPRLETGFTKPETGLPKPETGFPKAETGLPKPETAFPKQAPSFPKRETSVLKQDANVLKPDAVSILRKEAASVLPPAKKTEPPTGQHLPWAPQPPLYPAGRVAEQPVEDDDAATGTGRPLGRIAAAAVALIVISAGGVFAGRKFLASGMSSTATGTLAINSNPPGAQVVVDGLTSGVTPLRLTLKQGLHDVELRGAGDPRSVPITITAGKELSQYIELPKGLTAFGQLQVRTEPAGAQVTVDGIPRGKSPVLVESLAAGEHSVVLEADNSNVKQTVSVEAGMTASLVVPMTAAESAPVLGWISLTAPVELQVFEGRRLVGTSQSDRLMMTAGRHDIEIVNETLGYRQSRTIQVPPGRTAPVKIEWPKGIIAINALPWADVWIDGERIGETPIGNLSLPIGPHEIVFRHPDLGEQKYAATVSLKGPVRVSVDLRKK
jgi:serine/threonine protein kinase